MREKHRAILMLAIVSFVLPMGQLVILKHRAEPWSTHALAEVVMSTYAIYWWYVLDKRERGFRAGPFQNIGVIFLNIVALPVYFIRSRGWKGGAVATAAMLGVGICVVVLVLAGEWTGRAIAS